MYALFLSAALLVQRALAVTDAQFLDHERLDSETSALPLVPDYLPPNFTQPYNQTYCPAGSTAMYIPAVYAYYPFVPHDVYNIVGSFVNITWISSAFNDTTYVGTDNVPGVIRTEPRDPFGAVEVLFSYETANTKYGFYHQQAAHVGKDIKVAPGLLEVDSHAVLQMMPACNGFGTSWGFYLTYCFDNATMAQTPGFDINVAGPATTKAIVGGTTSSLQRLWKILDGDRDTPFNSTDSCDKIKDYQSQGDSTE